MKKFDKPPKTTQEHIELLQERGLQVHDIERATHYLTVIGYYRLSAYNIPFRQSHSEQFKAHTTFEDILNLYNFDRELRLLVMDALERIEVAIRAQMVDVLCVTSKDGFWYTHAAYFYNPQEHETLINKIKAQLHKDKERLEQDEQNIDKCHFSPEKKQTLKNEARKETSYRHYLTRYDEPKLPPAWMVMEKLTWGDLSHLYSNLRATKTSEATAETKIASQAKKQIAQHLGVQPLILESWLKGLNNVRNICAHHERFWNREHGCSIKIPKSSSVQWLKNPITLNDSHLRYEKRSYIILVALQTLLYKISPQATWAKRLKTLIDAYPQLSKAHMGMPEDWDQDPFWEKALKH